MYTPNAFTWPAASGPSAPPPPSLQLPPFITRIVSVCRPGPTVPAETRHCWLLLLCQQRSRQRRDPPPPLSLAAVSICATPTEAYEHSIATKTRAGPSSTSKATSSPTVVLIHPCFVAWNDVGSCVRLGAT